MDKAEYIFEKLAQIDTSAVAANERTRRATNNQSYFDAEEKVRTGKLYKGEFDSNKLSKEQRNNPALAQHAADSANTYHRSREMVRSNRYWRASEDNFSGNPRFDRFQFGHTGGVGGNLRQTQSNNALTSATGYLASKLRNEQPTTPTIPMRNDSTKTK